MPTPIRAESLDALPHVRHAFFTRGGGVSEGIYAGLNCGFGSSDERGRVRENRRRATAHMLGREEAIGNSDVLTPNQVHSDVAVVVDAPWQGERPKADAVVTRRPGLLVGVLTADCAPVLLADAQAGVVAAAHAGWRGALGGILEASVAAMEGEGARREHIHAVVGPCIGPGAYEVGPELEERFLAIDRANARFFKRADAAARPYFDLPGYVSARLAALGLARIEDRAHCTYRNEAEYFSYRRATHRREPDYGRQLSAIMVVE
jgi:YfiH family protein